MSWYAVIYPDQKRKSWALGDAPIAGDFKLVKS